MSKKIQELYSIDSEKCVLSGIFNYPDEYFNLEPIITASDFAALPIHSVIWSIYGSMILNKESPDINLLAAKLNDLKISTGVDLTVLEYLEALSSIKVKKDAIEAFAAKIKKFSIRRELAQAGIDAARKMVDYTEDASYLEIVNTFDSTVSQRTNLFEDKDNEPIDLFKDLEQIIEDQGNKQEDIGVFCPFPILRQKYGDFSSGDLYVFASRMKSGKSTFLMNIAQYCANGLEDNVKVLYLDTELTTKEVQNRLMSLLTGINENLFMTGKWRNNDEYVKRVRATWPLVKTFMGRLDHIKVGNKPIEEVNSLIRRWYRKNISNTKCKALIIYDYIKINADLASGNYKQMQGHDLAGYKVDCLKQLASELGVPIISAVQTNRGNAGKTVAERGDNTTVISLSDQIGMYVSNMYLFNALTLEEIQDLQINYNLDATHRLVPLVTRKQGEQAPGFNGNYIKITDKDGKVRYAEEVIYYKFENFKIIELTTLSKLVKERETYIPEQIDKGDDGELL